MVETSYNMRSIKKELIKIFLFCLVLTSCISMIPALPNDASNQINFDYSSSSSSFSNNTYINQTIVNITNFPGGVNRSIQFNNNGTFAGTNDLKFTAQNNLLIFNNSGGDVISGGNHVSIIGDGDLLNVGNLLDGWVELEVAIVGNELGLITGNDEFLAVKESFPFGDYIYGNGALRVIYNNFTSNQVVINGSHVDINSNLFVRGNISANNICYSNGTNCNISATVNLTNIAFKNESNNYSIGTTQSFRNISVQGIATFMNNPNAFGKIYSIFGGGSNAFILSSGSNQDLAIQAGLGLGSGIAISSIDDANSQNMPIEFRANGVYFSQTTDKGLGIFTVPTSNPLSVAGATAMNTPKNFSSLSSASFQKIGLGTITDDGSGLITCDGSDCDAWTQYLQTGDKIYVPNQGTSGTILYVIDDNHLQLDANTNANGDNWNVGYPSLRTYTSEGSVESLRVQDNGWTRVQDIMINKSNSGSSLSDQLAPHLIINNDGGSQSLLDFIFGGVVKSGVRADSSGNLNWHTTGNQGNQFYNSLDISDPTGKSIASSGFLVTSGGGNGYTSSYPYEVSNNSNDPMFYVDLNGSIYSRNNINTTSLSVNNIPIGTLNATYNYGSTTAKTLMTYRTGAKNGTYELGFTLDVRAVSLDVLVPKVNYTTPGGTFVSSNLFSDGVTSASINSVSTPIYSTKQIAVKANTTVVVYGDLTTGIGSILYDSSSNLRQVQSY